MADQSFQARVNPIFATGKGTTLSLAGSGNKEAMLIASKMDLSIEVPRDMQQVPPFAQKGFSIALEARYEISNQMLLRENKPYVIDLPSGYTPRALFAARNGLNYVGFDLPIVADAIGGVVRELLPEQYGKTVAYYGMDATNYASMSSALESVDGEVCIVTDGLLAYFNESEIRAVLQNMKSILAKHGGSWITGDMTSMAIYTATFGVLLKDNPAAVAAFTESTANQMSEATLNKNSLFNGGIPKAKAFLDELGFAIEEISFAELLPDLCSLADMPGMQEELRAAYSSIAMWKLTLKDGASTATQEIKDNKFGATLTASGNDLSVILTGRLDTISAPELLEKYESMVPEGGFASITVDAKDLQYVSSAGLRVLLMMYKALEGDKKFQLINANEEIMNVLAITGFDQFLLH